MTVYMVFEPPVSADQSARAERISFVRDRFTWSAFLFAPIWMLAHRLWLVLAGYVVAVAVVASALWALGAGMGLRALAVALVGILVGLESASLRRWTLLRRGWRDLGTVTGDDLEAAERRFFDADVRREAQRPAAAATAPSIRSDVGASDVIGLFPQPGGNR